MKAHICFIGKLGWRHRWSVMAWSLRALWLAVLGYMPTVHLTADAAELGDAMAHRGEDVPDARLAPGSFAKQ